MGTRVVTDHNLLDILSKLEPDEDLDGSLRKLLIKKARTDLIKYWLIDQRFRKEYGMDFSTFKASEPMKKPVFKVEQNYFDWEMAVTMIEDLDETLKVLKEPSA